MFSTRDKILLALIEASRNSLSGATLARRFGLTRTSVWKQIRVLKKDGFNIRADKAKGYTLLTPFDASFLKRAKHSQGNFWKMRYQFSTVSTQELAKHAAEAGSPEGHFWLVEKQTGGRGRLDRRWESPLGGIWMSLLLRPSIAPALVPSLTLVLALTLAETLQSTTSYPVRLKWPNDVLVKTPSGWRKIAGILTEMSAEVDRTHWVVIGVGVNVNNSLPHVLNNQAISLVSLSKKPFNRASLLKDFLNRFGKAYRRFEKTGFDSFRKLYWERYSRPDEAVKLKTAQGVITGVARDVDARGALVVESHNQTQSIWEGEIVL